MHGPSHPADREPQQDPTPIIKHPDCGHNHYPSNSSSNLSSCSSSLSPSVLLHRGGKSSSLTSTTSLSSSSSPSSSPKPSSTKEHAVRNNILSHDECSIQSALSMYQAFAAISDSANSQFGGDVSPTNNCNNNNVEYEHADNDDQLATNLSLDETVSSSIYNGDVNETNQSSENCGSAITGDENNDIRDDSKSSERESNSQYQKDEGGDNNTQNDSPNSDNEIDDESTTSWTSFLSTPLTNNFLNRHQKKIGTILVSMTTLWVYSHYHKSKQLKRRRKGRQSNHFVQSHGQLLGMYRWLMQILSPSRILKYLQRIINVKLMSTSLPSLSNAIPSPQRTVSSLQPWKNAAATPLSHLLAMAKTGNISKVMLRGSVLSYLHSMQSSSVSKSTPQTQQQTRRRWSQTNLPSQNPNILNEIISTLLKEGCDDITTLPESLWQRFLKGPAIVALPFAYLAALYWMMRHLQRQQFEDGDGESDSWKKSGGSGRDGNPRHVTTFDDVAGIEDSLQELSEVISYMRNPASFHAVGAEPPRGILLHGPPGSGKTLLARAIAGEAERNVDGVHHMGGNTIDCFAVCSGSEFVETYVGRGAARVRSLFKNVREEALRNFKRRQKRQVKRWNTISNDGSVPNRLTGRDGGLVKRTMSYVLGASNATEEDEEYHKRPMAIIFIDEIDALAKRRDSGIGLPPSLGGGGCDEREQTLNQLLTEMDGFVTGGSSSTGVNVIVIAATNRPEVLDPAIMRPGRFDRHVRVALPDHLGREAILRVHARRIRWDRSSVNFGELPTHNFSGAHLKNVINEAALLAVRSGHSAVTQVHLLEAVQKVRAMMNRYGSLPRHQDFMHYR